MKVRTWKPILAASLIFNLLLLSLVGHSFWVRDTRADVGPNGEDLAPYMAQMQHLSHKLGLSIQAHNAPLASFYIEEMQETAGIIQKKFPTYDKVAVGTLMGAMLVPQFSPLARAVTASNWAISNAGYAKLLESCNGCHAAANHGFIHITTPTGNPFNQSFSPQ
ncbi:MAG TPA: hypothetical protein VFH88_14060 [Candidatus Krumholzibacteria bacterium]|nr:hypothetical protein [Candidatus Krumholzibacteria bacterium]